MIIKVDFVKVFTNLQQPRILIFDYQLKNQKFIDVKIWNIHDNVNISSSNP